MAETERIPFDFTGDAGVASLDKLEDIMRAGHWGSSGLMFGLIEKSEPVLLLLRLLEIGGIALYKRDYVPQEEISPEIRQRAEDYNVYMRKRDVRQPLLDIASLFYENEFDGSKTVFNSLFFPAMRAFVRCGSLTPEKLFEMLERDGCDRVLLFSGEQYEGEYCCHEFLRAMPRHDFMNALEAMRKRTLSAMHEAICRAEAQGIFPSLPVIESIADEG